jgi:hypothetical protein
VVGGGEVMVAWASAHGFKAITAVEFGTLMFYDGFALNVIQRTVDDRLGAREGLISVQRELTSKYGGALDGRLAFSDPSEAEMQLSGFLAEVDAGIPTSHPKWEIKSWLFGIIERFSGRTERSLELTGHAWAEWIDGDNHDRAFAPTPCEVSLTGLEAAFLGDTLIDESEEELLSFLDYAVPLAFSALVVATVTRSRPWQAMMGKTIYLCWSGGDYVTIEAAKRC